MKAKRSTLSTIFLILAVSILLLLLTNLNVHAASYRTTSQKVLTGKYYIWVDLQSKYLKVSTTANSAGQTLVTAPSGQRLGYRCVSNGTYIYYSLSSASSNRTYFYRIKTNGTGKKYLGSLKALYNIGAYYNGYLYLSVSDKTDPEDLHTVRYDLKKKKTKRVISHARPIMQYNQYVIAEQNSGAAFPGSLYVYNCKTGKKLRLSTSSTGATIRGKYLYYAKVPHPYKSKTHACTIYRCSISGGSKKVIAKNIKATYVTRITGEYVYYSYNGDHYRYSIASKQSQRISYYSMPEDALISMK